MPKLNDSFYDRYPKFLTHPWFKINNWYGNIGIEFVSIDPVSDNVLCWIMFWEQEGKITIGYYENGKFVHKEAYNMKDPENINWELMDAGFETLGLLESMR